MIEFFMSKFWAILCGLILLCSVSASIQGLSDASEQRADDASFRNLVKEMESFLRLEGSSSIELSVDDVLSNDEEHIKITRGSIWLIKEGTNEVASIDARMVIIGEGGVPVADDQSLTVHRSGTIVLVKSEGPGLCELRVRYENVSTTFLTDSMNMSQSFASL